MLRHSRPLHSVGSWDLSKANINRESDRLMTFDMFCDALMHIAARRYDKQ